MHPSLDVDIDLYFHTPDGPVKINVEAYVVKGMSTPLILGNDFADQYSISVIRQEGSCTIEFGDSNRRMPVNNSVSVRQNAFRLQNGPSIFQRIMQNVLDSFL